MGYILSQAPNTLKNQSFLAVKTSSSSEGSSNKHCKHATDHAKKKRKEKKALEYCLSNKQKANSGQD